MVGAHQNASRRKLCLACKQPRVKRMEAGGEALYPDAFLAHAQPALVAASTTAINALTALVSSSGSSAAALSGSAALSVVSTLLSLTANPAAVSPAAAPAALAGGLGN